MTEIYYVPGSHNYYNYDEDVVVLDENLKEYPLAREYILAHELKHAEIGDKFWANLKHEFKSDLKYYFGSSEEIQEVREYFADSTNGMDKPTLVILCRSFWDVAFAFCSGPYQFVRKLSPSRRSE